MPRAQNADTKKDRRLAPAALYFDQKVVSGCLLLLFGGHVGSGVSSGSSVGRDGSSVGRGGSSVGSSSGSVSSHGGRTVGSSAGSVGSHRGSVGSSVNSGVSSDGGFSSGVGCGGSGIGRSVSSGVSLLRASRKGQAKGQGEQGFVQGHGYFLV